jgi:hypothetical protein
MNSGDRNPEDLMNGSDVHDGACIENGGEGGAATLEDTRSNLKVK